MPYASTTINSAALYAPAIITLPADRGKLLSAVLIRQDDPGGIPALRGSITVHSGDSANSTAFILLAQGLFTINGPLSWIGSLPVQTDFIIRGTIQGQVLAAARLVIYYELDK
jgi:hypothetical protein